jgi:AraC-like DNA-binding protein
VDQLASIIASRAVDCSCSGPTELGIQFHRVVEPTTFHKAFSSGPSLTVVAHGRKRARFGSRELDYDRENCIVIIGEGTFDAEVVASAAAPYLAATIVLPVELVVKVQLALADEHGAAHEEDLAPAYLTPFTPELRDVVVRLMVALGVPEERRILAPLILEELVYRLLRSNAAAGVRPPVGSRDVRPIHEAMRYIRANATRPLTVGAMAKHVAMSASHFAHRFSAVAHVSPMRFLKQVRLDAARALIRDEGLRVGEVASRVGYESASHFSRDFKVAFGITPVEFGRRIAGSGMSSAAAVIAGLDAQP